MPAKKKRKTTKPIKGKRTTRDASGGHDTESRRKWKKGGRIEAYTYGEALKSKRWP